jgi:hypothetical protein
MIRRLQERVARRLGPDPPGAPRVFFKPVHWAKVLQAKEDELSIRLSLGGELGWKRLRGFMVNFAADAIAYQPIPRGRDAYDEVHALFAGRLRELAEQAGPRAPLCVISHSLGTVIASNFFYDLQTHSGQKPLIAQKVLERMSPSPLANGETLALFYTLGSPLALWSMRYARFGTPLRVPSPKLPEHYPQLSGEWVNFYDRADVIGYPLRELNEEYHAAVSSDRAVRVGSLLRFWNPLSHMEYFEDGDVLEPIADGLARVWSAVNP